MLISGLEEETHDFHSNLLLKVTPATSHGALRAKGLTSLALRDSSSGGNGRNVALQLTACTRSREHQLLTAWSRDAGPAGAHQKIRTEPKGEQSGLEKALKGAHLRTHVKAALPSSRSLALAPGPAFPHRFTAMHMRSPHLFRK